MGRKEDLRWTTRRGLNKRTILTGILRQTQLVLACSARGWKSAEPATHNNEALSGGQLATDDKENHEVLPNRADILAPSFGTSILYTVTAETEREQRLIIRTRLQH